MLTNVENEKNLLLEENARLNTKLLDLRSELESNVDTETELLI